MRSMAQTPSRSLTRRSLLTLIILLLSAVVGFGVLSERRWLWWITEACTLDALVIHLPFPCTEVDLGQHVAILRASRFHYLLMPTVPLSGIESDKLLRGSTQNYFGLAWARAQALLDADGKGVVPSIVGLAV